MTTQTASLEELDRARETYSRARHRVQSHLDTMTRMDLIEVEGSPEIINYFEMEIADEFYPIRLADGTYIGELKRVSNGHSATINCVYRWSGDHVLKLPLHKHPHREFCYVTSGFMLFEKVDGTTYPIGDGDYIDLRDGEPHIVYVNPSTEAAIIWKK